MRNKRYKGNKESRDGDRFVALPHIVLDSPSYRTLGYAARSLLIDIARQFAGDNNGRLVACSKYLAPLGWNSNDTITRALRDLKASGLLIETRMGMRPNRAAWFALGWQSLDASKDMDIDPRDYRRGQYQIAALKPINGVSQARTAPKHGVRPLNTIPIGGAIQ